MYVIKTGYAEVVQFPGCNERLEREAKEVRRQIEHIESLTLGFSLCARAVTLTEGGYPEEHPPLCSVMVEGMQRDLDLHKEIRRGEIINAARPEVQVFIALGL
jgi:hypothetical protein